MNIWIFLCFAMVLCYGFLLQQWMWLPVFCVVLYMRFTGLKSMAAIFISGLFIFSFFDLSMIVGSEQFAPIMNLFKYEYNIVGYFSPIAKFLIAVSALGILFFLFFLRKKFLKNQFIHLVFLFSFFVLIPTFFREFVSADIGFGIYIVAISMMLAKMIFYYLYVVQQYPKAHFFQFSKLVFPTYWDLSVTPRPNLDLDQKRSHIPFQDKAAFKLMLLAVMSALLYRFIITKIWGQSWMGIQTSESLLPSISNLGLDHVVEAKIERWKLLLSIFVVGLASISGYFYITLMYDAFYRIIGLRAPLHIENIFKAKNFGSFMSALMPYYIRFIHTVYIFPLYRFMRKYISSKSIRYEISLFIGIMGGGYLYHLSKDYYVFYQFSVFDSLRLHFNNAVVYFSALYIAVRFFRLKDESRGLAAQGIIFLFWLFLYSIIFSYRLIVPYSSFEEKFNFYLYLFGLK